MAVGGRWQVTTIFSVKSPGLQVSLFYPTWPVSENIWVFEHAHIHVVYT